MAFLGQHSGFGKTHNWPKWLEVWTEVVVVLVFGIDSSIPICWTDLTTRITSQRRVSQFPQSLHERRPPQVSSGSFREGIQDLSRPGTHPTGATPAVFSDGVSCLLLLCVILQPRP